MPALATERYANQLTRWPEQGQHILAHFDDDSIIAYQAHRREIAEQVLARRTFGGRDRANLRSRRRHR